MHLSIIHQSVFLSFYLSIDHHPLFIHLSICYSSTNKSIYNYIFYIYNYLYCIIHLSVYLYCIIYLSMSPSLPLFLPSSPWRCECTCCRDKLFHVLLCCAAGVGRLGASVAAARPAVRPAVQPAQQQAWRRHHCRRWRRRRRRWRLHQHQPGRRGRGVAGVRRPHIRLKNWWGCRQLSFPATRQSSHDVRQPPKPRLEVSSRRPCSNVSGATQYSEYLYTPLSSKKLCPVLFQ